jgi:hypothetical protein
MKENSIIYRENTSIISLPQRGRVGVGENLSIFMSVAISIFTVNGSNDSVCNFVGKPGGNVLDSIQDRCYRV